MPSDPDIRGIRDSEPPILQSAMEFSAFARIDERSEKKADGSDQTLYYPPHHADISLKG
jgi:hypothetical protein